MATYTKTVDPNGGADYASIALWEAGEQTLYSSGDIAIADCLRTGATKDTTAVTVAGWTAGVIPKIIANAAHRHEGKWADTRASDGNYIYTLMTPTNNSAMLDVSVPGGVVDGLLGDVQTPVNRGFGIRFRESGTGINCIVRLGDVGSFSNADGFSTSMTVGGKTVSWINCMAWDTNTFARSGQRGFYLNDFYQPTVNTYNCTVYGNSYTIGFLGQNATRGKCFNSASFNCGTDFSTVGGDYNVSSDATAPGTNVAHNKTAYADYFVDHTNGDFHLKSTFDWTSWISTSANLYSTFTTDIDGNPRPNSDQFGIGADVKVAAGGGETITIGKADFGWSGKSVKGKSTISVTRAPFTAGGQSVSGNISASPATSTISWAGSAVHGHQTASAGKSALGWSGKEVKGNQTSTVGKTALSWAGQAITATAGQIITIGKAALSWVGQSVKGNQTARAGKGSLSWYGRSVSIAGELVRRVRKAGLSLRLKLRL